jgi:energy-coupling factor transport system substrate-specific component
LSTQSKKARKLRRGITLRELIIFALLGVIMFISKVMMEALPNVHLLGALTITYTVVYRWKALIPIYVYVILNGLFAGFDAWWLPYLYIWTILWAVTMLIPQRTPKWLKYVVYPMLCAIHGLSFGILYSPAQAIMFGLDFNQTIAWVAAGIPFDIIHCIGNLAVGFLCAPLSELLFRLEKQKR